MSILLAAKPKIASWKHIPNRVDTRSWKNSNSDRFFSDGEDLWCLVPNRGHKTTFFLHETSVTPVLIEPDGHILKVQKPVPWQVVAYFQLSVSR